MFKMTLL